MNITLTKLNEILDDPKFLGFNLSCLVYQEVLGNLVYG